MKLPWWAWTYLVLLHVGVFYLIDQLAQMKRARDVARADLTVQRRRA